MGKRKATAACKKEAEVETQEPAKWHKDPSGNRSLPPTEFLDAAKELQRKRPQTYEERIRALDTFNDGWGLLSLDEMIHRTDPNALDAEMLRVEADLLQRGKWDARVAYDASNRSDRAVMCATIGTMLKESEGAAFMRALLVKLGEVTQQYKRSEVGRAIIGTPSPFDAHKLIGASAVAAFVAQLLETADSATAPPPPASA